MDERFQRIETKLDKMSEDIGDIKSDLKYHIRRTDLLEESVSVNKQEAKALLEKIETDMKPIKRHVLAVSLFFKGVGFLAVLVGMIVGLIRIIEAFQ